MKDDLQLGKIKETVCYSSFIANSEKCFWAPDGNQKVAGSIPVCGSETFFWVCDKAWVANSFPLIYQAASHPSYIYIYIYTLIRYTDISRLLFSSTCVALTNRYISWPSLCHLSPGSSMVRASHRRSEGCGFDSRLGLRNIFLSLR